MYTFVADEVVVARISKRVGVMTLRAKGVIERFKHGSVRGLGVRFPLTYSIFYFCLSNLDKYIKN
jgi:hypothetical protein